MTLLFINSRRLRVILDQCFFTFWPSSLMGNSLEASLKFSSNFVQFNMMCVTGSAAVFALGFLFKPLFDGARELPFATWLPFDWRAPGIYECVYTTQVFTNLFLIILSILGHDFIFLALASNVVAQFHILSRMVDELGSGRDRELNTMLLSLEGVVEGKKYSEEQQLLVKIIAHHQKLLFICEEMENIFSPTLFVQLATSLVAICVSSFLLTAVSLFPIL